MGGGEVVLPGGSAALLPGVGEGRPEDVSSRAAAVAVTIAANRQWRSEDASQFLRRGPVSVAAASGVW